MRATRRKNPALVELILVILFFALSAVILVQVFVKAKAISQESRAQTTGLILIQDKIEQWKTKPTDFLALFPTEEGWTEEVHGSDTHIFLVNCGKEMHLPSGEEADYEVCAELTEEPQKAGVLYRIWITITKNSNGNIIADCKTANYVPQEAAP